MPTKTSSCLARLLIPYCLSRVFRLSSSSNRLEVFHTNLNFGSCSFHAVAQLFGTPFRFHSVYLTHLTLSGSTLKLPSVL